MEVHADDVTQQGHNKLIKWRDKNTFVSVCFKRLTISKNFQDIVCVLPGYSQLEQRELFWIGYI